MDSYEEEEADGLVHSSFTIACTSSSSRDGVIEDATSSAFSILSKYERTAGPCKLRQQGYLKACKEVRKALESTVTVIYDSLVTNIEAYCCQDQNENFPFFIPGSSQGGSSSKRLSAAALVGPQLSRKFEDRMRDTIEKRKDMHWFILHPWECTSLASTIRLLIARLTAHTPSLDLETGNLSSLSMLPSSSTAVIYLPSLALQKFTVLNDFVKSLHSSAQKEGFPHIVLIFGLEGGAATLDDKLDPESIQLLDMKRFNTPYPSTAFEVIMQELFLNEKIETEVWLGSSTLEMLRYQYFERGYDLDKLISTVELAFHHHFATRPLSSVITLRSQYDCDDWEPIFYDRLRLQIVEADAQDMVSLPRPLNDSGISKQDYLHQLLTDNDALLRSMADFARAIRDHRSKTRRAVHLLHVLRSHFLNQAGDDNDEAIAGPRRTSLGGLALHVLSDKGARAFVNGINAAVRRATMGEIEAMLEDIRSSHWASEATFQASIDSYLVRIRSELEEERLEDLLDIDSLRGLQRVEMVQKKLLREESSDAVKRSLIEWCGVEIQSWTRASPLLSNIWCYDFSSYLNLLLDPSPRLNILTALNDPSLFMSIDQDTDDLPDICQVYQMYQSAGKMINLADWYKAFSQSISDKTKNQKRHREAEDNNHMVRGDVIQARFALAVCELGRMGFLKRTRRKPDHVLKVVYDLPPSSA